MHAHSSPALQPRDAGNYRVEFCSETGGPQLATFESRAGAPARRRILILKLDHRGDFLIGLPALQRLRAIFPDDHLTLVCASWNRMTARDLGAAYQDLGYDYFLEA